MFAVGLHYSLHSTTYLYPFTMCSSKHVWAIFILEFSLHTHILYFNCHFLIAFMLPHMFLC